jgi:signal transduction histidine kinase
MAVATCASLATLTWFGYRAIGEWRRSSGQVADRRAAETADLLVTALTRDMRGVQNSVLSSPRWDDFMLDPYDVGNLAAGAFARYPYPESFFGWHGVPTASEVVFFNRADRRPVWMLPDPAPIRFPVVEAGEPALARRLVARIAEDAKRGRRFSIFEMIVDGVPYQIVARLRYRDALREALEAVFGFTVNLPWVREHYFPELTRQVTRIGNTGAEPGVSVVDERGQSVAGPTETVGRPATSRAFPVMFFDPLLVALDPPSDLSRQQWTVQVDVAHDPTLAAAIRGANRTLALAALAAATLVVGVLLTARAARINASLAEMRSEFVSTVTHELKTPIATIRAVGDSLVSGRVTGAETLREYAQLVVQEAKRLTRLVDNLLAYARITDVTEAYSFEPIEISSVIAEVLREFHSQLESLGFEVDVDIPLNVPSVRADRTAIELMFDNLVDNAIRYSGEGRWIQIRARPHDDRVAVEISDRGIGIPEDEVGHVVRRFFRGRRAGSGGSGLGLAIAHRIIKDHGGILTIRGGDGPGTTVSVVLPTA